MDTQKVMIRIAQLERGMKEAQSQKDRLEGSIDNIMERLKNEYHVNNLEEAEALLEKATAAIAEEEKRLDSMMQRLTEQYGWEF